MHSPDFASRAVSALAAPTSCPLQILIVTRDRDRRDRITGYLNRQRCRTDAMETMPAASRLKASQYNLLLLDVELDPLDGFEVLRRVRAESDIPVIMMRGGPRDDYDRVMGLELGADDFVEEPVNPRELLARGRAILRRHGAAHAPSGSQRGGYRFAGWELHRRSRQVFAPDGSAVAMSRNDYALLLAFLQAPGRPLSRLHLMRVTRPHEDIYDRSIDVQVLRLRRKLKAVPGARPLIRTDRHNGYVFDTTVEPLF